MTNKELAFLLTAVAVSLGSFWMLARYARINTTISGNLAQSRIAGQEAINTVLSLPNLGLPARPLPPCNNVSDPTLSCMDLILTTCSESTDPTSQQCLLRRDDPQTSDTWKILGGGLFSRKIRFTETSTGKRTITVLIWWSDEGGFHNSPISRTIPDKP